MRIIRQKALQVHPVPAHAMSPKGPFPKEMMAEPVIVYEYDSAYEVDGSDFELGATVQNKFKPPKYLRCSVCLARVIETETQYHVCEDVDGELQPPSNE